MQHNTLQHNMPQHNTIQHNTLCKTVHDKKITQNNKFHLLFHYNDHIYSFCYYYNSHKKDERILGNHCIVLNQDYPDSCNLHKFLNSSWVHCFWPLPSLYLLLFWIMLWEAKVYLMLFSVLYVAKSILIHLFLSSCFFLNNLIDCPAPVTVQIK